MSNELLSAVQPTQGIHERQKGVRDTSDEPIHESYIFDAMSLTRSSRTPTDIMKALSLPEEWTAQSACSTCSDPDAFYPEHKPDRREREEYARSHCAVCPVRAECLAYAMDNGERHGIWGGLTAKERDGLRKGSTS